MAFPGPSSLLSWQCWHSCEDMRPRPSALSSTPFELEDGAQGRGTQAECAGSSHMNKAFVRDSDAERASNALPDRPIPPGPNLVTPAGLAQLDTMVAATEEQQRAAVKVGDPN